MTLAQSEMQPFFFSCPLSSTMRCFCDMSSSANMEPCTLVTSYSTGKALLFSLLGRHMVLTQLFLNRHFAICFPTLEKDASEYAQCGYVKRCILTEVLGGDVLVAVCSQSFRSQSLHKFIRSEPVISIP